MPEFFDSFETQGNAKTYRDTHSGKFISSIILSEIIINEYSYIIHYINKNQRWICFHIIHEVELSALFFCVVLPYKTNPLHIITITTAITAIIIMIRGMSRRRNILVKYIIHHI